MKEENPLVSIIVITCNSAKYVLETLESAKAQTYQNIELIVSDDCSTDTTVELCLDWIEENKVRFARTNLIQVKKNTGIPSNCNRGVKAAQGEWIKLIAGDDVLLDTAIFDYLDFVVERPDVKLLFAFSNRYKEAFKESNFIKKFPPAVPTLFTGESISAKNQFLMLLNNNTVNAPTVFLVKKIIDEVGGFDKRFRLIEDHPMWLKLTKAGYKFHFLPKITVNHRFHNNATDSFITKQLHKQSYFNNELFRKEYIYPNLTVIKKYNEQYKFFIRKIMNQLGLNRKIWFLEKLDQLFVKYLNPFAMLDYIKRKT